MKNSNFIVSIIAIFLLIFILAVCTQTVFAEEMETFIITEDKDEWSEEFLWNTLRELCPNDEITAGIMGYFWRESNFKSDAVTGWYLTDNNICQELTEKIDTGLHDGSTKKEFLKSCMHYGGYGLGQWYGDSYINDFYDYMSEHASSIADAKVQCEFTVWSMSQNETLWSALINECETAIQCGRRIGYLYDGASETGVDVITSKANDFYQKYSKKII